MKQNVYDNADKTIVLANPLLSFIPKQGIYEPYVPCFFI